MTRLEGSRYLAAFGAALAIATAACSSAEESSGRTTSALEQVEVSGPYKSVTIEPGDVYNARVEIPTRQFANIFVNGNTTSRTDIDGHGLESRRQTFVTNPSSSSEFHDVWIENTGSSALYLNIEIQKPESFNGCWLDEGEQQGKCRCVAADERVLVPGAALSLGSCKSDY